MKKVSYLFLLFFTLGFFSCVDDDNDVLTGSETVGGLVTVQNRSVAYALGEGLDTTYPVAFSVFQGNAKTVSVDIFNQFTDISDPANPVLSNKVLLRTITLPMTEQLENQSYTVTYNQLIAGLSVNGAALPASDADVNVGDFWTLSYVSTTSDGKVHQNLSTTKVTVSCISDLAGSYSVSTARVGTTTVYTFATDNFVVVEPGTYNTDYIGPYYSPGQTPGSANTVQLPAGTRAGFTFTDICGKLKLEDQNLASAFSNVVYQTAAQNANSLVNQATGVVVIHYTISFAAGDREFISTYTPN